MIDMRWQVREHLRQFLISRGLNPADDATSIENSEPRLKARSPFPILIDRSRVLRGHKCPRMRWFSNEFAGRGISSRRVAIPLATGQHVHVGLSEILAGKPIDEAVKIAVDGYKLDVEKRGIQVPADSQPGAAFDIAHEQAALIEALLRAYHAYAYPRLLEDFEVVEREQEDVAEVRGDGDAKVGGRTFHLMWMARTDGLLQERISQDLYVLSFKTAATWDRRTDSQCKHDMQGLSEPFAIEDRLARGVDSYVAKRIEGVKMEYLLKGVRREYPKDSRNYVQYSPLIYGYRLRGVTPDQDRYSWEYKSAKGWEKFKIWEAIDIGGVKGWIDMLMSGRVEPIEQDCIAAQFVVNPPYMRHPEETANWKEQILTSEEAIADASEAVNMLLWDIVEGTGADEGVDINSALNQFFPQHTQACDYPSACDYSPICWDRRTVIDLLETGEFVWRQPHHEPEREMFEQRGLLNLPVPELSARESGKATICDLDEVEL